MRRAETTSSRGIPSYSLFLSESTGHPKTAGPTPSLLLVPSTGVVVQHASFPRATLVPSAFRSGEPAGFPSSSVDEASLVEPICVPIHPSVRAERIKRSWGTGLRIRPAPHSVRAGARWIRRCRWWRTVHGSRWYPAVLDAGQSADGAPWIVLEAPRGLSLTQWQQQPVPIQALVDTVMRAGQWLHAIHERGWAHHGVHADILFRTTDGLVSVFGWGSVGPVHAVRTGCRTFAAGVQEVGFQTDIAALARIVLHHPDVSAPPGATAHARWEDTPNCDPLALRSVLERAVCPTLSARWPDMAAFVAALEAWRAAGTAG